MREAKHPRDGKKGMVEIQESEDDARPADVEIGSTAGRTHAQVLEQTLGRERAFASQDGPPVARGSVLKERRREGA